MGDTPFIWQGQVPSFIGTFDHLKLKRDAVQGLGYVKFISSCYVTVSYLLSPT